MSADLVPTRHNIMVKEACLLFFFPLDVFAVVNRIILKRKIQLLIDVIKLFSIGLKFCNVREIGSCH